MVTRVMRRRVCGPALLVVALVSIAEAGQGAALADAVKRGDRGAVRTFLRRSPTAVKAP